MTVIAYDLNTLVADGRVTLGDDIVTDKQNKLREIQHPKYGKMVAAFCGALMLVDPWAEHIQEHGFTKFTFTEDDEEKQIFDAQAILVDTKGQAFELLTNGLWNRVDTPIAFGSGRFIAQHFLKSGHTAVKAVRETIKTNTGCGGQLTCWNWRTGLYTTLAR